MLFCGGKAGEMAHKAHIKEAMTSTNRKSWEIQIMSLHARKGAMVHATQQMHGKIVLYDVIFLRIFTLLSVSQTVSWRWKKRLPRAKHGCRHTPTGWIVNVRSKHVWDRLGGSSTSWNVPGQVLFLSILSISVFYWIVLF